MKSFDQLARTTQRTWLKQLADAALGQYGIKNAKLRLIAESSSTVFRVDTVAQRYVLRIHSESMEQWMQWTEAELLWLLALKRDTELSVPVPIAAPNGTFVHRVSTNKLPEGRIVTLLRWIPGRRIGRSPVRHVARQIGACLARLHDHTEHFSLPEAINRPHTEWGKLLYWQDRHNDTSKTLTPEQRNVCASASERLFAEINEIGTAEDYGLVHADLTLNNCLLHEGQLNVIDFADCRFSSHYYDLAVPLTDFTEYWQPDDQEYERLRAEFYEGYSRVRPLGRRYDSAVATFIIARAFDVIEWIHLDWPHPTYFSFGPALLSKAMHRIRKYMDSSHEE